jgi:hypothetical protein
MPVHRGRDVIDEDNLAGACRSRDDKIGKIFAGLNFLDNLVYVSTFVQGRTNVRQTFLEDDARQDNGRCLWYVLLRYYESWTNIIKPSINPPASPQHKFFVTCNTISTPQNSSRLGFPPKSSIAIEKITTSAKGEERNRYRSKSAMAVPSILLRRES